MTSLITLNTQVDGTFNNYFQDSLTFPPNSEVALVKCMGADVEYSSYEYLQVPAIDEANRDIQIMRLCVDGVNTVIKWNDIYDAYEAIITKEGQVPVDVDDFFDGLYRWTLNPDTAGNVCQSICKAFDKNYEFYEIRPNCVTSTDINYNGQRTYTKFGITSTYSTKQRLSTRVNNTSGDINNLVNFCGTSTLLPGKITTTADDTIVYSTTDIAINGGYLSFKVNDDQACTVGVTFDNIQKTATGTYNVLDFSFGVKLKTHGPKTFSIVRNGVVDKVPYGYTGDDETFHIVFSRVNSPEAAIEQTDYTAYLLQGYPGGKDYQKYTIARLNMSDGYLPSFMLDAPKSGTVIETIQCTQATDADRECRSFSSCITNDTNNKIQSGGTVFRNSHSFILRNSDGLDNGERESTRQFFTDLGFNTYNSSENATQLEQIINFSNPDNNKLIIPTQCKSDIIFGKLVYLPGIVKNPDTILKDDINLLSRAYQYLQFHIETLDAVSYEGNFVKGEKTRQQNTSTRVLQTIPLNEQITISDNEGVENHVFNYDYEVYNPYYIALNNPAPMTLNQLQGRLVTPNNDIIKLPTKGNVGNTVVVLHVRASQ